MVVSALMVLVLVTVIVAAPPQLKVTVPSKLPKPGRQTVSVYSLQLAPVPPPTTHAKAALGVNAGRSGSATVTAATAVKPILITLMVPLPCPAEFGRDGELSRDETEIVKGRTGGQ
jgi:hypothetical protein